jgi:hypothetical protein
MSFSVLNSSFFVLSGDGSQRKMETLCKAGFRCLSLGEFSCWQMKRHVVNRLTRSRDSIMNIQGKSSLIPKQCIALVDDSSLVTLRGARSNIEEDQELLTGRVQSSWSKTCLRTIRQVVGRLT